MEQPKPHEHVNDSLVSLAGSNNNTTGSGKPRSQLLSRFIRQHCGCSHEATFSILVGILFAPYDAVFKKYHKLSLSILKEFRFGVNRVMETRILNEVD